MPLVKNLFIHALAGSGKTTKLINFALKFPDKKILITTFTNKNIEEIKKKIIEKNGIIPSNIIIMTWYAFLLNDGCRPYQRSMGVFGRIVDIVPMSFNSTRYVKEDNVLKYYFSKQGYFYSDKIAKFAVMCNEKTHGAVIRRIEESYDYIFVDEAQDLSGYDFELLEKLLRSNCKLILVGDKRQKTFKTSPTPKNKKYSNDICLWFSDMQKTGLGTLMYMRKCWRCNENICEFSSKIYPELPQTEPANSMNIDHLGIFYLRRCKLSNYVNLYSPTILTNSKKSKIEDYEYLNFGNSKGSTIDRVIIVPTKNILSYLKTGNLNKIETGKERFYIAMTRARYSVAFLIDNDEILVDYHFQFIEFD